MRLPEPYEANAGSARSERINGATYAVLLTKDLREGLSPWGFVSFM
jgi:hypothetical protein